MMTTYKSLYELNGETLKLNDNIIFNVKGKEYHYVVNFIFVDNATDGENERIFKLLDIEKREFCSEKYGYKSGTGGWPEYKRNDYEALTRAVLALFKLTTPSLKDLLGDKL